ncbi:hypothetical protein ACXYMT_00285 [Salinimicrobium sp. CAU 1759]
MFYNFIRDPKGNFGIFFFSVGPKIRPMTQSVKNVENALNFSLSKYPDSAWKYPPSSFSGFEDELSASYLSR